MALDGKTRQRINDWIKKYYPTGIDLYADYRDEISPQTAQKILDSKHPEEAFNDYMFEAYDEYAYDEQIAVYKEMLQDLELEEDDAILDAFYDVCYCNYPDDHFLKQEFRCDIFIDTGNWDYDCTCEDFGDNYYAIQYGSNEDISGIQKESSILWLARKQGYSKMKLFNYLNKHNYAKKHPSKFLASVYQEMENITSHMNILVFAKHFTLEELIELKENPKPLKLSKNISCGLFDPFNGGGSLLEIELEKDIVVDPKWIEGIYIDNALGKHHQYYGIDDVYGMMDSFWERGDYNAKIHTFRAF